MAEVQSTSTKRMAKCQGTSTSRKLFQSPAASVSRALPTEDGDYLQSVITSIQTEIKRMKHRTRGSLLYVPNNEVQKTITAYSQYCLANSWLP